MGDLSIAHELRVVSSPGQGLNEMDWRHPLLQVRAALMRRGKSREDADDLVQEAWIRLNSYSSAGAVEKPAAFLMRAAINLSIDVHRVKASQGEEVLLEEAILVDPAPHAEAVILSRERVVRVGVCLGRLTGRTRQIFLAHRLDGLTYQELAQLHDLSITAVEKHVAKATLLLTRWMEGW